MIKKLPKKEDPFKKEIEKISQKIQNKEVPKISESEQSKKNIINKFKRIYLN